MDKEFELLKRVKAENDEEFNVVPTKIKENTIREFTKKFISNYSFLYYGNELELDEEIDLILKNIYLTLDTLVEMGVHPGYIFQEIVLYNAEKAKRKTTLGNVEASRFIFPYKNVGNELHSMNDYNYKGFDMDLYLCYDKVLELNKKCNLPYGEVPHKLDNDRKKAIFISYINQRDALMNADDLIEESIYLVNMLYTSFNLLIEMGINSFKVSEELNKIINSNKKGKTR